MKTRFLKYPLHLIVKLIFFHIEYKYISKNGFLLMSKQKEIT